MIPPATWELNEKIHKLEDQLGDARLELARSQARWATALEAFAGVARSQMYIGTRTPADWLALADARAADVRSEDLTVARVGAATGSSSGS